MCGPSGLFNIQQMQNILEFLSVCMVQHDAQQCCVNSPVWQHRTSCIFSLIFLGAPASSAGVPLVL